MGHRTSLSSGHAARNYETAERDFQTQDALLTFQHNFIILKPTDLALNQDGIQCYAQGVIKSEIFQWTRRVPGI